MSEVNGPYGPRQPASAPVVHHPAGRPHQLLFRRRVAPALLPLGLIRLLGEIVSQRASFGLVFVVARLNRPSAWSSRTNEQYC